MVDTTELKRHVRSIYKEMARDEGQPFILKLGERVIMDVESFENLVRRMAAYERGER